MSGLSSRVAYELTGPTGPLHRSGSRATHVSPVEGLTHVELIALDTEQILQRPAGRLANSPMAKTVMTACCGRGRGGNTSRARSRRSATPKPGLRGARYGRGRSFHEMMS